MTNDLYLPTIHAAPTIAGQAENRARILFDLMRLHAQQGRSRMVWNEKLAHVAEMKVRAQARDGWTGHVDPDGHGPNWWVRAAGYALPDWYSHAPDANNIESLSLGGNGTITQTWEHWLLSEGHKIHLLGIVPFFAAQTEVGVGYYHLPTSAKRYYYCVLSAPPEGSQ